MKRITPIIAALTAVALPTAAIAQGNGACLTPNEAQSLLSVALPDIVTSMVEKCGPTLPASAYLNRSSTDLIARYRTSANASWPAAKRAIGKLAGGDTGMLASLPDEALKGFFTAGISTAVAKDIKPDSCSSIDRGIKALAPLPPENTADLIGLLIEMDSKRKGAGGKGKAPFNICPA